MSKLWNQYKFQYFSIYLIASIPDQYCQDLNWKQTEAWTTDCGSSLPLSWLVNLGSIFRISNCSIELWVAGFGQWCHDLRTGCVPWHWWHHDILSHTPTPETHRMLSYWDSDTLVIHALDSCHHPGYHTEWVNTRQDYITHPQLLKCG